MIEWIELRLVDAALWLLGPWKSARLWLAKRLERLERRLR
jgi:hypothetical protein